MRKAKLRGLSDLIFLISQSKGGGLEIFHGLSVRAVTLSHVAFTRLPSPLPILLWTP